MNPQFVDISQRLKLQETMMRTDSGNLKSVVRDASTEGDRLLDENLVMEGSSRVGMTTNASLMSQAGRAQAAAEYSRAASSDTRTMGEINQAAKIIATKTLKDINTALKDINTSFYIYQGGSNYKRSIPNGTHPNNQPISHRDFEVTAYFDRPGTKIFWAETGDRLSEANKNVLLEKGLLSTFFFLILNHQL